MEYLSSHSFWVYLAGFCRSACEVRPVPASSLYYVCAFLMKFQSNPKIRDPDYAVPISLPFFLWRVTAQFPLACMSTGMWAYILLLGGRRCKSEYLLFLWGIGRTAANILWTHHCNPPPFLNAALWNTFLPFAAVVQLQGVWDKMKEYPKPGMGLLSSQQRRCHSIDLTGWLGVRCCVFEQGMSWWLQQQLCCVPQHGTWWIVSHGT